MDGISLARPKTGALFTHPSGAKGRVIGVSQRVETGGQIVHDVVLGSKTGYLSVPITQLFCEWVEDPGRAGDWFQTSEGVQFWLFDPRIEDIDPRDIAHAGANICRWGGHCKEFFSVGQHNVLVGRKAAELARAAGMGEADVRLAHRVGFLHDAHESYKGDTITPVKRCLPVMHELEELLDSIIFPKYGITREEVARVWPHVARADLVLLATERRDITNQKLWHAWNIVEDPAPESIVPLQPREAKAYYLEEYARLWP